MVSSTDLPTRGARAGLRLDFDTPRDAMGPENDSPRMVIAPGTMPRTNERGVIFFANLLSLFFGNRDETRILRERVGRIETYGGRLIPILNLIYPNKHNLLVLERAPTVELTQYFSQHLKLALPEIRELPHRVYARAARHDPTGDPKLQVLVRSLHHHPADWLDGFVTDQALCRLAEAAGKRQVSTFEGSRYGNDKARLHRHLEESGLPVFDSFFAQSGDEAHRHLKALKKQGYRQAVIKAAVGASGVGLIKTRLDRNPDIPPYLFKSGPALVQGWLDESFCGNRTLGSPSVQLYLSEDAITAYDITDQILDENSIHQGNVAPPACVANDPAVGRELLRQAGIAGKWLHRMGFRGTASADFLVMAQRDEKTAYLCEINARVTGATYPSMLARHFLPGGAWQMRNVLLTPAQKPESVLDRLARHQLLFSPGDRAGLLPVNFNQSRNGKAEKAQILALAPNRESTCALFAKLQTIDEFSCQYDRD